MRQIKFRGWDERNKVMHYDFRFINSGNEGNDWILFISDNQPLTSNWKDNPYFYKQIKIMQFTGIKDKNGKDIYVEDIVKFGDNQIHKDTHGKVFFCEKRAQFIYEFIDGKYKGKCTDMWDEWRTYEVIGNIHEHPRLLKEATNESVD